MKHDKCSVSAMVSVAAKVLYTNILEDHSPAVFNRRMV